MILDARTLTYSKDTKTFCCEASDLGNRNLNLARNIRIHNPKTIAYRDFEYIKMVFTDDGYDSELGWWLYRSSDGIEFHIFND